MHSLLMKLFLEILTVAATGLIIALQLIIAFLIHTVRGLQHSDDSCTTIIKKRQIPSRAWYVYRTRYFVVAMVCVVSLVCCGQRAPKWAAMS
jgi:hypothetical protein